MAALSLEDRSRIRTAYNVWKELNGINSERGETTLFNLLFGLDPPPDQAIAEARVWIGATKRGLTDQVAEKDLQKVTLQRVHDEIATTEDRLPAALAGLEAI